MTSVTKQVQAYVMRRPSLRDCLGQGLVNHSAVAREICAELGIHQFDAVVAALRRLGLRTRETSGRFERAILRLLRKSTVKVVGNLAALVFDTPKDLESLWNLQKKVRKQRGEFTMLEGEDASVVIFNETYAREVKECVRTRVRKFTDGLALITLICDERLEETPGVTAFVYGRLAASGINILEERSCWTDLSFVVSQKDLARTLELLDFA
jgi:hypothetical protein